MKYASSVSQPYDLGRNLVFSEQFAMKETELQDLADIAGVFESDMPGIFIFWQKRMEKVNHLPDLSVRVRDVIFKVLLQEFSPHLKACKAQEYLSIILEPAVRDLYALGIAGDYLVVIFHTWEMTLYHALRAIPAKEAIQLRYFLALDHFFHLMLMTSISLYIRLTMERQPIIPLMKFTVRQKQILTHLAEGLSSKEVAQALNVGVRSIESHRLRLMKKVGASNLAELLRFAVRSGIVSP